MAFQAKADFEDFAKLWHALARKRSSMLLGWLPGQEAVLHVADLAISFGVITLLFAMMFKLLPDAKVPWRDVWIGAGLTSLLFTIGKFLIGLYLGKAEIGSSYGAAGSLVILLSVTD